MVTPHRVRLDPRRGCKGTRNIGAHAARGVPALHGRHRLGVGPRPQVRAMQHKEQARQRHASAWSHDVLTHQSRSSSGGVGMVAMRAIGATTRRASAHYKRQAQHRVGDGAHAVHARDVKMIVMKL